MKNKIAIVVVVTMWPSVLLAQQNIAAQETSIPGGTLAMAAYIALWFLLLGYFLVLTTRLKKIRSDIRTLESRIDELFED